MLHRTVQETRDTMSNREYHQWRAFLHYRNELVKLEQSKVAPGGR